MSLGSIEPRQGFENPWQTLLLNADVDSQSPVLSIVKALFKEYKGSLEESHELRMSGRFKFERCLDRSLKQALRDFYMRLHIEKNSSGAAKTQKIARLVFPGEEIFNDIDEMLAAPFISPWRLLGHYYDYKYATASSFEIHDISRVLIDVNPSSFFKAKERSPLQRYRIVHAFLTYESKGHSSSHYKKAEKKVLSRLDSRSETFDEKAYFYTILKTNEVLREKISGMFRLLYNPTEQTPLPESADAVAEHLASQDEKESKNVFDQLKRIRVYVSERFFNPPKLVESSLERSFGTYFPVQDHTEELSDKETIYLQLIHASLPGNERRALIENLMLILQAKNSLGAEIRLKWLCKLAQWLYKTSSDYNLFEEEVKLFNIEANNISEELKRQTPASMVQNAWDTLFSSECNESLIDSILLNLHMECVRIIRLTSADDLKPKKMEENAEEEEEAPAIVNEEENESVAPLQTRGVNKVSTLKRFRVRTSRHNIQEVEGESSGETLFLKVREEHRTRSDMELGKAAENFTAANLFDMISNIIMYYIVTASSKKNALANFSKSLKLARRAITPPYVNLFLSYAIVAGINRAPASRMKFLLERAQPEDKEAYDALCKLFDYKMNFKNYHTFVKKSKYPVIPYTGLISQMLAFSMEGNGTAREKSELVDRILNEFQKNRILLKAILPIKQGATDAVDKLWKGEKGLKVAQPRKKMEAGISSKWQKGEWKLLSFEDKLYAYSIRRWK